MEHVLVVDDDPIVCDVVGRYLELDGYRVTAAYDGEDAIRLLAHTEPSVVVLDVMLPGVDGLEVCRQVRRGSDVPVILLTARAEETDRIVGLELGADDYVTKPFSPRELTIRVRNILRRGRRPTPTRRVVVDRLAIDPAAREVLLDDAPIRLTAREFDLLHFLASHPRQVFSRDHLMDRVWGDLATPDPATVTVHVRRLREKVERHPSQPTLIQTVWGIGYRFVA